jgi:Na+-transporting NADH:ubiquinone oxidoreductase subunit NqrC
LAGNSKMNRNYFLAVVLLLSLIAVSASASLDQLLSDILEKEKQIDSDQIARPSVIESLNANGHVNDALKAAISGDSKALPAALEAAEKNLQTVAKQLPGIVAKGVFKKPLKEPTEVFDPHSNQNIKIANGDEALSEIALLAQDSADAISRIREGKGGQVELAQIVRNSTTISRLILLFYGVATG